MPDHDVVQGVAQRHAVHRAGQAQRERHVVGGGGVLHLAQHPHAVLGVRHGGRAVVGAGHERGPAGRAGGADPDGQGGRGGRLEQVLDGDLGAQRVADGGDEPSGEQGVPAEGEEVGVAADLVDAEHGGEGVAHGRLGRAGGRGPVRGRGAGSVRGGQRGAVELAVGGQRQRVEHGDRRGHAVGGQGAGAQRAPVGRVGCGAGRGHGVRGEPPVARPVLADGDGGLGDARVGGQHALDLAEFDPEAPDLHLVVAAPEVGEGAVVEQPHQVAGAVHAGARRAVGVGDEPVGGQVGAAEVAAGEAVAGDVQLAGEAGRHRAQRGVQDAGGEVRQGAADRGAGAGGGVAGAESGVRDVHRGLGDAVHVDQRDAFAAPGVPAVEPGGFQRLAAEHDVLQRERRAAGVPVRGVQLEERARRLAEHGDPFAGQQGEEAVGRAADRVGHDDEPAAVQQRAEDLPDGEVEGVAVEQGPHVVGAEAEQGPGGREQPHHVGVRDDHALGTAGGAGGVDDVGRARRVHGDARSVAGPPSSARIAAASTTATGRASSIIQARRSSG